MIEGPLLDSQKDMQLFIKEIVKEYQTTLNLLTPIDSSYLYNVQARIVRVINEDDHYWYETSAYIPASNGDADSPLQSTGARSITIAEKNLLQHLEYLQQALLEGRQLIINEFYKYN